MESEDNENNQLVIKKEENLEYVEDNTETFSMDPLHDVKSPEKTEESISCKLKSDPVSPSTPPLPSPSTLEEADLTLLPLSQSEEVKMETSSSTTEDQQQLDAAYSLMQVTSAVSSRSSPFPPVVPPEVPPSLSVCTSTLLSSISTDSTHPLSPPTTQSDNSSINSSSNESEQEFSPLLMDSNSKHSSASLSDSPRGAGQREEEDPVSPRKRKVGHDSGVENGSESDCPDSKRSDLDFSIDMSKLTTQFIVVYVNLQCMLLLTVEYVTKKVGNFICLMY